ncbi:MAG: phosphoribosylglycinamide formyltransferase [Candidatus Eisenbacteria sp.]|nr:phosphoribosylglycinamide formyltransferase [Candidatus Eisenbacteria bacterium]
MAGPLALGILVSGRGSNMEAVLDAIGAGQLDAEVRVVLSDVESAPALRTALSRGVPALHIPTGKYRTRLSDEAEKEWVRVLREHGVEVIALAGFMRMIHETILSAFAGRIVNIHPALLPAFPGLHGQRQALDYGAKVAGCTVHFVNEGMDTGPIIGQRVVRVEADDTEQSLSARILEQEHELYPECLQLLAEGRLRIDGRRVRILSAQDALRKECNDPSG